MDSQHAYRACDLFSWTWPVSVKCFFSLLGSSRVSLLDSSRVWSITKAWKAYKAQKEHLEETKNWLVCTCYYLNDLKKSIPNPTQVKQVKWRQRKVDFAEKDEYLFVRFVFQKFEPCSYSSIYRKLHCHSCDWHWRFIFIFHEKKSRMRFSVLISFLEKQSPAVCEEFISRQSSFVFAEKLFLRAEL